MEAKPERLQKVLAAAGIASRRKAEELIAAGLVSVNGHVVTEPGTKADPRLDEIRVEGKLLRGPERHVYLAMYKPKGTMTTVSDPEGRPTVMDLLKEVEERVFPVGRLDYMSEGLLLLTNDGDLMAQLTRAGSHVAKTYMVKVSGKPTDEAIDKLRSGIMLPPEPGLTGARGKKQPGVERRSFAVRTLPAIIQLAVDQENPWFEVTLTEGRNRQLRRMFEQIGHHIEKIKRIRYGSLTLDLEPGKFRHLTPKEVNQLRKSLDVPFKPRPIKTKTKHARAERPDRQPRIDSARFVQGRRGRAPSKPVVGLVGRKPSAEAPVAPPAAGAPPAPAYAARPPRTGAAFTQRATGTQRAAGTRSAAGPASGASSARRPFQKREDRGAAFSGRGFGTPRGPEFSREKRRDGRSESEAQGTEGFAAKRRLPRKPEPGSGSVRGPAAKPGFARKPGFDRGGQFSKGRFSKGPGKPEGGETRPGKGFTRYEFKRGEVKRGGPRPGEVDRGGAAAPVGRSSKPGASRPRISKPGGFGSRSAGAPAERTSRGDFKRSSSGEFQRTGSAGFKRPGSKRVGSERVGPERPRSERPSTRGPGFKRPDFKQSGFKKSSGGRFGLPSGGAPGRPSAPAHGAARPPRLRPSKPTGAPRRPDKE